MAKNIFNSVQVENPSRSHFDLSHEVKFTCDMGPLIPVLVMECVPGDKFRLGCESLVRFAPLVSPVMHEINMFVHYWFVPYRLIWENWEEYITNSVDPLPAFPTYPCGDTIWQSGSLMDYFGLPDPTGQPEVVQISAMAHGAYQCIYHEWYRDENLVPEFDYQLVNGSNAGNLDLNVLRLRAWEKDYFTAALPFAQKGQPVNIPLGTLTDVPVYQDTDTLVSSVNWIGTEGAGPGTRSVLVPTQDTDLNNGYLYASTSDLDLGSTTINDLRRAFRLQEWLEIQARAGSRYVETILGHFGVRSSDKRLQRPEYITGVKSPVRISEVLQTGETGTSPQGNMAGHAVSYTRGKYGSYYCEEHGVIMGIMSVVPKPAYQNGIPKFFLKTNDPFDFYWPKFANIGEQPVVNDEVYAYQPDGADTFGYVPRYSEYKFMPSRTAGEFRSTLDYWTLTRQFGSPPGLNEGFIEVAPAETERIFAVEAAPNAHLYVSMYHSIQALRKMPKYGTPTI